MSENKSREEKIPREEITRIKSALQNFALSIAGFAIARGGIVFFSPTQAKPRERIDRANKTIAFNLSCGFILAVR